MADYESAAEAGQSVAGRKGVVVSIVDILLCAMAMKREWSIFTTDPDFMNYSKVLPVATHTPRG